MHVLLDLTNGRAIARHESFLALAALAYIQFANLDTQVFRCGANKHFSALSSAQITSVITNLYSGKPPPLPPEYGERLKLMRALLETTGWLELPFAVLDLVGQAHAIDANDDTPYAFEPSSATPTKLRTWTSEPQRNVKRADCSMRVHFAAGPAAAGAAPSPPPPGKAAPSRRPAPPTGPAAPTPAPKAPRAASGPAKRPKPGTGAGQVWDIADAVLAANPNADRATLRPLIVEQAKAAGINFATAYDQFKKWSTV